MIPHIESNKDTRITESDIKMWADAYAAFVGAFDTPIQRRRDESELAVDARERIRAWNERMREIAVANDAATRTLEALGYEYCGGEQWKPPVTPPRYEAHLYKIKLPCGDERHVRVFWSERDEKEGVMTHNLSVTVKKREPSPMPADEPIVEAAPVLTRKLDLNTLRTGDRVKVTLNGEVIDEAATLLCPPQWRTGWRTGWRTLHFVDESGGDFFRSKSRDVRTEKIDGSSYASGGWEVQVVEWTNSNE